MTTDFDRFLSFISSTDFKWRLCISDAKIPIDTAKTVSQNLHKFLIKEGNGVLEEGGDILRIKTSIFICVKTYDDVYEVYHAFTENGLYMGSAEIAIKGL